MENTSNNKKFSYLKAHLLLLIPDTLALGTFFGFEALSELEVALSARASEVIIDEGAFYLFILLYLVFFHLIIIISVHTPISKKPYKEIFFNTFMFIGFFTFFFSGYFVSSYVENKLINEEYHFCDNLSFEKKYMSTHYVWRAKNETCNATNTNSSAQ